MNHPTLRPYYAAGSLSVRFYDAVTHFQPSLRGDLDFYVARLGPPPKNVLVLGCGTGRVALALATRSYRVTGVDVSEPMLRLAQEKHKRLPAWQATNMAFMKDDMLTLDLLARFQAAIVPFYAFNHIGGRTARVQALATMARHVIGGGTVIIHAASREALRASNPPSGPGLVIDLKPSDIRLEVTWGRPVLDEASQKRTQSVEYRVFGSDGSLLETSIERLVYYWFSDAEFEREADRAGLKLRETLPSFTGPQGRERIYILEKPR